MAKKTISFIMLVCLSVWPTVCPSVLFEQLGSHWVDFIEFSISVFFRKSVEEVQVSLKYEKS
jgi:hypothetical protein